MDRVLSSEYSVVTTQYLDLLFNKRGIVQSGVVPGLSCWGTAYLCSIANSSEGVPDSTGKIPLTELLDSRFDCLPGRFRTGSKWDWYLACPWSSLGGNIRDYSFLPYFLSFRSSLILSLSEYKDAALCVGLSDRWKVFSKILFDNGCIHLVPFEPCVA